MKNIPSFDDFVNENSVDAVTDRWRTELKKWESEMMDLLKGKKLGNLPLIGLEKMDSGIKFSVETGGSPNLRLDWMLMLEDIMPHKAYIGVSSPNRKGVFEKRVTGKNATPAGAWKTVEEIYDGKFSRMA